MWSWSITWYASATIAVGFCPAGCIKSNSNLRRPVPLCRGPVEGELHTSLQAAFRRGHEQSACTAAPPVEATGWLGAIGNVRSPPSWLWATMT